MLRIPLLLTLLGALTLAACTRGDARNAAASVGEHDVDLPLVTVYKTPTCGCCVVWAEYMEDQGFTVRQVDVANTTDVRQRLGVPAKLASCHTAVVGDYVVEGHVPAEDVKRLLRDRPEATGIAVPGMPIGSPGMEVPDREAQPYEVLLFASDGRVAVFARH